MKIIALDGYTLNPGDNPWDEIAALGELQVFDRSTPEQLLERAESAEILIVNKVRIDAAVLARLPRLQYITVTATGFDCVDAATARERHVLVSNVPVYGTDSVAQFVMAQLLHVCHQIGMHDQAVRSGEWQRRGDFSFWDSRQIELRHKKLGIIGFGRIGKRLGELAHAFGMPVLATTRGPQPAPDYAPFAWMDLDSLLAESDVISLNCPLTPVTKGLVNRDFLDRCKTGAILLNASRGGLVVEADLAAALGADQLAAAVVDVVADEPISPENPLLRAKNCWITPHMAWATWEARRRLMQATAANIAAFLAGNPQNLVG